MDNIIFKNINREYCNTDAIDNVISYIYRTNDKSPLPIYCYGSIEWPPTYDTMIKEYHLIREISQAELPDQQMVHFIISLIFRYRMLHLDISILLMLLQNCSVMNIRFAIPTILITGTLIFIMQFLQQVILTGIPF